LEKRIADLTDPPSLREAVRAVEGVVHVAACHTFHGKKEVYGSVNVQGTRALLEACLVVKELRGSIYRTYTLENGLKESAMIRGEWNHPVGQRHDAYSGAVP
jgi:nucleoside-diphosphate-sugar epimerase